MDVLGTGLEPSVSTTNDQFLDLSVSPEVAVPPKHLPYGQAYLLIVELLH